MNPNWVEMILNKKENNLYRSSNDFNNENSNQPQNNLGNTNNTGLNPNYGAENHFFPNSNLFHLNKSKDNNNNSNKNYNDIPLLDNPRVGIMDTQRDWKKVMSDKLMRRMIDQRKWRLDSIRNSKDEILRELRFEEMLSEHFDEDAILSELFDKLVSLFENEMVDAYQLEVYNNKNISVCPKCSYPVILTEKRILCLNLCFEYNIPNGLINDGFTLDNFVDLVSKVYSSHPNCLLRDSPQLLEFEDDVHLVCGRCLTYNY
jgi:hypothetical protein